MGDDENLLGYDGLTRLDEEKILRQLFNDTREGFGAMLEMTQKHAVESKALRAEVQQLRDELDSLRVQVSALALVVSKSGSDAVPRG